MTYGRALLAIAVVLSIGAVALEAKRFGDLWETKTMTTDAEGNATFVRKDTTSDDFENAWGRYRTTVDRTWGVLSIRAKGYDWIGDSRLTEFPYAESGIDPATGAMRFDIPVTLKKHEVKP